MGDAVGYVEDVLGVSMGAGGNHARFGTHNRLIGLAGGLYLEAIAINPNAQPESQPRWFDLDRFSGPPRLHNWICRVDDMDAALNGLPDGAGQPVALARGDLRWKMAVPETGILPFDNLFPALIEWQVATLPGDMLPASGCVLTLLEIAHPEAAALKETLPLKSPLVQITQGSPALRATFSTPHGNRVMA